MRRRVFKLSPTVRPELVEGLFFYLERPADK